LNTTLLGVLIICITVLALIFAWATWGYYQDDKRYYGKKKKEKYTVRVHFISGEERIVPTKHIQDVGEGSDRRGVALVDGREVPIYNRVEWGFLWYEQDLSRRT
jgi:hypothetical protein